MPNVIPWRQNRRRTLPNPALLAAGAFGVAALAHLVYHGLRKADLRGQVALVTGGSRGLGLALSEEFARAGCKLAICARDQKELDAARKLLEARGAEVLALRADVANRDEVERLVREVTQHYGHIDILVNVAGIISSGPFLVQTLEDFQKSMDIMFWGIVNTTFAVLPQMLRRHSGRIVNITSIGGKVSVPHLASYSAAKFAAVGFSEGMHTELAKEGIVVTTVCPGLMRTGSYLNALFKGEHQVEFTLFGLLDNLPLISFSARRAARQIVDATRQGEPELIISISAQLLTRFHGLFPGLTQQILALIDRTLPRTDGSAKQREAWRGVECETPISRSWLFALGHAAAREYNELLPARQEQQIVPDNSPTPQGAPL